MGIQLQQLDISNIKMKLFFVIALFIASAFAENRADTSLTGPAELVKHIAEFDDKSARACVSVKAPKVKPVEVKLTKAQFDDLLAKCKNNEPIDLSQYGVDCTPVHVSAQASAKFSKIVKPDIHILPHPIVKC